MDPNEMNIGPQSLNHNQKGNHQMITLTKQEVEGIINELASMPFNRVANIINFLAQKVAQGETHSAEADK